MFTWDVIGQLAWTGIASSTYYCLFAIAFALMLKVNRVWNFGQAGMMVVAYFAMFVSFRRLGLHPVLGILTGAAATIAAAWRSNGSGSARCGRAIPRCSPISFSPSSSRKQYGN